jgi:hypothetical protein
VIKINDNDKGGEAIKSKIDATCVLADMMDLIKRLDKRAGDSARPEVAAEVERICCDVVRAKRPEPEQLDAWVQQAKHEVDKYLGWVQLGRFLPEGTDEFSRHEVYDRASVVMGMFDSYVVEHDVVRAVPVLRESADKALAALMDFYQLAAAVLMEDRNEKQGG